MVDLNKISAQKRTRRSRGASMVEFALLVLLIAIVAKVSVGYLGLETVSAYGNIENQVAGAGNQQGNCRPGDPNFPACRGG